MSDVSQPDLTLVGEHDLDAFAATTGASEEAMTELVRFRDLLAEWNTRMNLVGPSALAEFWTRHALDSAQLLQLASDARIWMDIGAGGGFPGVVIACLLKRQGGACVHLVESMAKRARFLSEVVQALQLPAVVHAVRAEALKRPGGLDVVAARACAPMPRLLEFASPHLAQGAIGLFLKGRGVEAELTEARQSWKFEAELLPSVSDPSGRIVRIERLSRVRS